MVEKTERYCIIKKILKIDNEDKMLYHMERTQGQRWCSKNEVGGEKSEKVQRYEKHLETNSDSNLCVGDGIYTVCLR